MPPVVSSIMKFVDYDSLAMILTIVFIEGGRYRYFNIPASIYAGLLAASSKGAFFDANIKDRYRFSRG
jgi:hypothetical protein